jgi:hypothetical protein
MYCVKCGTELLPEATFCTSCGSRSITGNTTPDIQGGREGIASTQNVRPLSGWRVNRLAIAAAGIALFAGGAYWYQLERNIVRTPEYIVGDKWTFEYPPLDIAPNQFMSESEVEKMRREHELVSTYEVTKGDDLELYAKKITGKLDGWQALPLPLWKSYATKNDNAYSFPLFPGKTWREEKKSSVPDGSITQEDIYKVGEWETLTVPAC